MKKENKTPPVIPKLFEQGKPSHQVEKERIKRELGFKLVNPR